jgi:hypothetical protein
MKPEEQRIAIAEACGWLVNDDGVTGISPINVEQGLTNPKICSWKLPDYLNDLNAMHEAEKLLYGNPNLPKKYTQQIKNAIRREAGVTKAQMDFDVCITATAAQRAEAFLRTINKWTTNPNEL